MRRNSRLAFAAWIALLASAVFGCSAYCQNAEKAGGEWAVPRTSAEWRTLDDRVWKLFDASRYKEVAEAEPTLGAALLGDGPGHYLPTICLAHSLAYTGKKLKSLPYFERALRLDYRPHNVRLYADVIAELGQSDRTLFERGERYLDGLARSHPKEQTTIATCKATISFGSAVELGDAAYLQKDNKKALEHYRKAQDSYRLLPPIDAQDQKAWITELRPLMEEYTTFKLYDTPDGKKRYDHLDRTFLKPKIDLASSPLPSPADRVLYRVAGLVVRRTDLTFVNDKGLRQREQNVLTDSALESYQRGWRFAMDAVQLHSAGKFRVETTWFDLEKATLTGLTDDLWKGIVKTRHLDPTKIEPSQHELFARVVREHDMVVFVWPRGEAARAYGGGPIVLPHPNIKLPERGCIRSLDPWAATCLHEFLHNVEGKVSLAPVHGVRGGDWKRLAPGFRGEDEVDWLVYLIKSVGDWKRVKYLR